MLTSLLFLLAVRFIVTIFPSHLSYLLRFVQQRLYKRGGELPINISYNVLSKHAHKLPVDLLFRSAVSQKLSAPDKIHFPSLQPVVLESLYTKEHPYIIVMLAGWHYQNIPSIYQPC